MKFIAKKVIKGKPYYYMQYGRYNSYLGSSVPSNIKARLLDFFIKVGKEEAKKLHPTIVKEFGKKDPAIIEVMRHVFILISRSKLFSQEYQNYLNQLTIHFTFNSNRSEGSKVTRKEIEHLSMKTKRKPKTRSEREVLNSFAALKFAFSKDMNWNPLNIKRLHALLLNGLDDPLIVGKWKRENVVAPGNQPTARPEDVNQEMKDLLLWLNKRRRSRMYPPLLATEFYVRFEAIHPFTDGNGRVGRILLNAILFHSDFMPIVFFTKNHEAHCKAITKAITGKYENFRRHFIDQSKKTTELLKVYE